MDICESCLFYIIIYYNLQNAILIYKFAYRWTSSPCHLSLFIIKVTLLFIFKWDDELNTK
jgi:hypothetical protein